MSESEYRVLCNRIVEYMSECNQRQAKADLAESLKKEVA